MKSCSIRTLSAALHRAGLAVGARGMAGAALMAVLTATPVVAPVAALGLVAAPAGAMTAPLAGAPVAATPTGPAEGLIVRLKNAPAHRELGRMRALAAREAMRWSDLLERAALGPASGKRAPTARAVGRDQVLLDFGRTLSAAEAATLAAQLGARPEVEWVAPNVREQRLQWVNPTPSDPYFDQQWWLHPVGGSDANALADRRRGVPGFVDAWASGVPGAAGRPGMVVALLDTGVTDHPDLAGRLLPGRDFVRDDRFSNDGQPGRDDDPSDPGDWVDAQEVGQAPFQNCSAASSSWHGTAVAGLLGAAGDNGLGVAGALRQGQVLPVRIAAKCGATVADIIDGLRWAAGLEVDGHVNPHPARVINLSFGGASACGREYQDTIDELRARGVVVVAAAGNLHGRVTRPANCTGVVGVAALNRDGFKAHYSSFGPALAASGIATVGGDDAGTGAWGPLLGDGGLVTLRNSGSTTPGPADYAAVYGTSFAAPLVAGTLALMLSVNPALDAGQLIDGLRRSARPHVASPRLAVCSDANPGRCLCTSTTCGAGILDTKQALLYAAAPDAYVAPARQAAVLDSREVAQAAATGADLPANTSGFAMRDNPAEDTGGGATGGLALAGLALAVAALARPRQIRVASRRA